MRRAAMLGALASAGVLSGCTTSPTPLRVPQATNPRGGFVTLVLSTRRNVTGELLAVTDTAWYLLVDGRVGMTRPSVITSLSVIAAGRGHRFGGIPVRSPGRPIPFRNGLGPDATWTDAAREVSRFPYGISAPILAALLERSSQSTPDDLSGAPPTDTDAFLARARAGTSRYRDQHSARIDGYKPVGVEFPAMGTHWVHFGRMLDDSLVAERPPVLIYVNVGGHPQLAGVGYTDLLSRDEPPPSALAPGAWHEHNGTVADESFSLSHASAHPTGTPDGSEMRLAVLHAWLWIPNPAGVFVTDNWALPSLRLGIAAPPDTPRDALHALALAADEDRYLVLALRTGLDLSPAEEAAAVVAFTEQRAHAMREIDELRRGSGLTPDATARLAARWSETWAALERSLPRRAGELRSLRKRLA